MSLDFKLHYDQLREGDPTKAEAAATNDENTFYDEPGHARNLCLIWPDGKRQFLNYSYLISGEFTYSEDINVITLNFSSHTVTLKGYDLVNLFNALLDHLPKRVTQVDKRYGSLTEVKQGMVVLIEVVITV